MKDFMVLIVDYDMEGNCIVEHVEFFYSLVTARKFMDHVGKNGSYGQLYMWQSTGHGSPVGSYVYCREDTNNG